MKTGCPQGTVCGSVLFLLFIDQVEYVLSDEVDFYVYADDVKIIRTVKNQNDCMTFQAVLDDFSA